ncbi:MAG: NAD+ synthase [Dehalococcoidia bacterium]
MRPLRLALAQINPTVGDLEGNAGKMLMYVQRAKEQGADIIAFPELALTGYPPEDLLFKRQFLDDARVQLDRLVAASGGLVVIVGVPDFEEGKTFNRAVPLAPDMLDGRLYNAAAVAHDAQLVTMYHKVLLPNYGVFDEARYFTRGEECPVFTIQGVGVGVNVCEDIWYEVGPATVQRAAGAEIIVNINASPYHRHKGGQREQMLAKRAADNGLYLAYVNTVGGQDELVFDGQSLLLDPLGEVVARGPQFEEALVVLDIDADTVAASPSDGIETAGPLAHVGRPVRYHVSSQPDHKTVAPAAPAMLCKPLDPLTEVYTALVTGTRDYVRKSGFTQAVIGLSGGIDSALTTAIAADALGAENVTTFFMPSQYTAQQSLDDSQKLVAGLGVRMDVLPIKRVFDAYLEELAPVFEGRAPDLAEENIQARIRGNLLMAASNKFGWIVLTTGNKSEMATGYATLYGDMAGGFAVIKDVPKTLVQQLCRHLNQARGKEIIPESIIIRPPTAELRLDQKDEDSLPPYAVLDPILEAYVEGDRTTDEMVREGMPPDIVATVVKLVDRSEYKRRQAPPGVKITPRAFGRDRRLPIVNRYRPEIAG